MATSVKLEQSQNYGPGGYTLTTTFSEHSGAGTNWDDFFILVRIVDPDDEEQDTYEHICTVSDVEYYKNDRSAAVGEDHSFYRINTWVLTYTDIETMVTEAETQKSRTQYLVDDWENYAGSVWPKTFEETYTS